MKDTREEIVNFGTIFCVVLSFLFISIIDNNSVHNRYEASRYEIKIESPTHLTKAIIAEHIILPTFQQSCLILFDKTIISIFNEKYRISVESYRNTHILHLLHNTYLSFINIPIIKLHNHHISDFKDDVPILS
jgi:hypothetical protein